jgi:hypothetical protein
MAAAFWQYRGLESFRVSDQPRTMVLIVQLRTGAGEEWVDVQVEGRAVSERREKNETYE